jgi:hypothetical protein
MNAPKISTISVFIFHVHPMLIIHMALKGFLFKNRLL